MELYDVFKCPFELHSFRDDLHLNFKSHYFDFKTEKIKEERTSKKEIYNLSKIYFDGVIDKYKNHTILGEYITESSFCLKAEIEEGYDLKEELIYSLVLDNEKQKIIRIDDSMINGNPSYIEGVFRVCISAKLHVFYGEEYDYYDEDNKVKKSIKEEECVICYDKQADILFLDCLHICTCEDCYNIGNLNKCPLCRKELKKGKIKI